MLRLAIANLKGGVGKSTTAMFLAECLALNHGLNVLVIDLDPQSNCSFMFLGRKGVDQAEIAHKTLPHFLIDAFTSNKPNNQNVKLNLPKFITVGASDLAELNDPKSQGRVDILPSIPKMWFIESKLDKGFYDLKKEPAKQLSDALSSGLNQLNSVYHVAIIDCPPGFSSLTRAGILLSDTIISPTIADEVSMRSLRDFVGISLSEILDCQDLTNHHVIVSKFISNPRTEAMRKLLRKHYDVLDPSIRYSVKIMDALSSSGPGSYRTFKQKYQDRSEEVSRLTDKVHRYIYKLAETSYDRKATA